MPVISQSINGVKPSVEGCRTSVAMSADAGFQEGGRDATIKITDDHGHLDDFSQFLLGEQARNALERAEAAEVGHDGLEAGDPAAGGDGAQDDGRHDDGGEDDAAA